MEFKLGITWWWVISVLFFLLNLEHYWVGGEPQVPCYFIFGDSLVDNGNNNNLLTLAKANFPPNGVDFRDGPTGRFCNGRTIVDVIAELLGFDHYIPPFKTTLGRDILKGVNYASAASGIRQETGQHLGDRICFDKQLMNHQITTQRIADILGNNDLAANYLSKCFYYVGLGSNDYLNNYFSSLLYQTSRQYSPQQYADVLIQQYNRQLMNLYTYGAKKVALFGLGPIGCIPFEIAKYGRNGNSCIENINRAVQIFNSKLLSLVDGLNRNLTDAKFIYINIYDMSFSATPALGFKELSTGCCGIGKNNGELTCLPFSIPCKNRSEYVFWDAYHPTEAANVIAGQRAYSVQIPSDAYPIDIRRLAVLKLMEVENPAGTRK